jgi:N utilization substance protein A
MKKRKEAVQSFVEDPPNEKDLGPESAGQSGDTQGLSNVEVAGPESVAELVEEGQAFEAEAIEGVEDAPDADVAEVRTKQVPEDDVPLEYLNPD